MKWIILIFIFSSTVFARNQVISAHHLKPLMKDGLNAAHSAGHAICETNPPNMASYISDLPRTEEWRDYFKVPTLLDDKLYRIQDVCADAKKKNLAEGVDRPYALIANKSHFCDADEKACLSTLKSVSDRCNLFVHNHFQVYHTRTWARGQRTPGSLDIEKVYGPEGPSLLVIRLSDCKLLPTKDYEKKITEDKLTHDQAIKQNINRTPPAKENSRDSSGEYSFKSKDDRHRFLAMKNSLLENLPDLKHLKDEKVDCYEDEKRTIPGVSDEETVPYGEIKEMPGVLISRKLMLEQYQDKYKSSPTEGK